MLRYNVCVFFQVVLLTRAGAKLGGRNMLNAAQVQTLLRRRYAQRLVVFDGQLSVPAAVSLFGQARLLVGPHGGAFYNLVYASKDATVVEFGPVLKGGREIHSLPHAIFWAMADMLGMCYWRIQCVSQNPQHDMIVDLDKLTDILDRVDAQWLGTDRNGSFLGE